jgi:hypothetical protein
MTYSVNSVIGVNFDAAPVSADQAGTNWSLGTIFNGNNASAWMWVLAPTALTTGDCVGVASTYTVSGMTNAVAAAGNNQIIGWAQAAFPASTVGWIALRGVGIKMGVTATTQIVPGVALYTTDGAGLLSAVTNSASAFQIFGATLYATASGATATASSSGIATFPTLRRPG